MGALIQAFVEDKSRSQLEIPNLTTTQRKQAKSIVEMHSELVCESLGFGNERRLHVFKKSGETIPQVSLVTCDSGSPAKNMFIDKVMLGGTNGSMLHQQSKDGNDPNLSE